MRLWPSKDYRALKCAVKCGDYAIAKLDYERGRWLWMGEDVGPAIARDYRIGEVIVTIDVDGDHTVRYLGPKGPVKRERGEDLWLLLNPPKPKPKVSGDPDFWSKIPKRCGGKR